MCPRRRRCRTGCRRGRLRRCLDSSAGGSRSSPGDRRAAYRCRSRSISQAGTVRRRQATEHVSGTVNRMLTPSNVSGHCAPPCRARGSRTFGTLGGASLLQSHPVCPSIQRARGGVRAPAPRRETHGASLERPASSGGATWGPPLIGQGGTCAWPAPQHSGGGATRRWRGMRRCTRRWRRRGSRSSVGRRGRRRRS